jgi:hypothetical protein
MKESRMMQASILIFWTAFWGLSVVDKVVPDVHFLWVGKDFFALFVKFFGSLGLKDPLFATVALAGISALEALNFSLYAAACVNFLRRDHVLMEKWLFRGLFASMSLFALFSIGDQVFGDRFQLLEHGLFWFVLLATWLIYKYGIAGHGQNEEAPSTPIQRTAGFKTMLLLGALGTFAASASIWRFSDATFANVEAPVNGLEVAEGVYKFDFPFLADKRVWEATVADFRASHPDLTINYIYTGPSELNSKKKTHLLLYIFTEPASAFSGSNLQVEAEA